DTKQAREESPSSLRALYGTDKTGNAVHGSDSFGSAIRELGLCFPTGFPVSRTLALIKP
ncbi:unnamed protein product, partial [Choristocarpus tenellus]